MRIACCLSILAVCLLAPSIAAADDASGFYVGLGAGSSHASKPAPLLSQTSYFQIGYGPEYHSDSSDQDSSAERLEVGYWANPYIGLQASYTDLGDYTHLVRGFVWFECQLCGGESFIESARVQVRGETLAVTGRLPLSDSFELIGRAGFFRNQVTYDDQSNLFGSSSSFGPYVYPAKRTDESPYYGLSFGWNFRTHWEALLGWDQYTDVGDSLYGQFSVRVISLGIQYHF